MNFGARSDNSSLLPWAVVIGSGRQNEKQGAEAGAAQRLPLLQQEAPEEMPLLALHTVNMEVGGSVVTRWVSATVTLKSDKAHWSTETL
jgi:hypothetical protein